jgi:hypothetical protein
MQVALTDVAMSEAHVFDWFHHFKTGMNLHLK